MRNVEFIEKSSVFHLYKNKLYFRNFGLKTNIENFSYIHFCTVLSNHMKYFRRKIHSTFELCTSYILRVINLFFFIQTMTFFDISASQQLRTF